jgi:uncharacterized protein
VLELDLLRGFALLGIAVVNLPYLGLPVEQAGATLATDPPLEKVVFAATTALFELKFVTLFALLFGMGFVLQTEKAAGRPIFEPYMRRLLFLGALGLFHGCVLFPGDILLPYACLGLLVLLLRGWSPRALLFAAAALFALGLLLDLVVISLAGLFESSPSASANDERELVELLGGTEATLGELERRVFREGPLGNALLVRSFEYAMWLIMATLTSFHARAAALILLGAALWKAGWLGERWRATRRRILLLGWCVGLPLEIGASAWDLARGPAAGAAAAVSAVVHDIGSLLLACAYALTLLALAPALGRAAKWIATLGRTALTSYLGHSVAGNLLFTGVGLGLFGALGRIELLLAAIAIWVVEVALANLWHRWFTLGPIEWLWRAFTRLEWPALRVPARAKESTDTA